MYAIVYLLSAVGLIRYCFSPSYRTECHARWQKTPKYRVVVEIGCGVIGLLLIGFLLLMIFGGEDRPAHNRPLPRALRATPGYIVDVENLEKITPLKSKT